MNEPEILKTNSIYEKKTDGSIMPDSRVTTQSAFNLTAEDQGGAYEPSNYLHECADVISNHQINIDEEKILDILQIRYRFQKDWIHCLNHCGIVNQEFFDYGGYLLYDVWKEYYDMGFTSILYNILDLHADLRSLNEKLRPITGSNRQANFYLSKGTNSRRPSFDAHTHDYNVIVKPIYGKVDWIVNGNSFTVDPEKRPNDVIVIPAFTEHQVIATPEPKLSLTINLTA